MKKMVVPLCTSAILVVGCGLFSSGTQELRQLHNLGGQNRYSRKVVLIHTHPGVIKCVLFDGLNQRGRKLEEMAKLKFPTLLVPKSLFNK